MFLLESDYETFIQGDVLDDITRYDLNRLHLAEAAAIAEMSAYLAARFDTEAIFLELTPEQIADEQDTRNPHMVMLCVHVTLYNAHMATSPDQIPELRISNRDLAIKYLEKVAEGKLKPDLPLLATDGENLQIGYGSNTKRINHY